jgi:hypothetical protein
VQGGGEGANGARADAVEVSLGWDGSEGTLGAEERDSRGTQPAEEAFYQGGGECGAAGETAAAADTDVITPDDILLPAEAGQAALVAPVGVLPAAGVGGGEEAAGRKGRAGEPGPVEGSNAKDSIRVTLPQVLDRPLSGGSREGGQAEGEVADESRSPAELRRQVEVVEARREEERQAAISAEKAWEGLVEAGAPRAEIAAAEARARALRKATDELRVEAEALSAAAMRKEDEDNAERVAARDVRSGGGGQGGRSEVGTGGRAAAGSAAAEWQAQEMRAGQEAAERAAAEAERMRAHEQEMEEARRRRAAQAEIVAKRRAETQASAFSTTLKSPSLL